MNGLQAFSIIMTAITPLALGLLTFFQVRREKKQKDRHELQEELEKNRLEREKEKEKAQIERFNRMETSITEVTDTVKQLKDSLNVLEVENQLHQLHEMTELNFGYIQSLSDTVIVIGNALATSDVMDDESCRKLDAALARNRKKEEDISQELIKILS